eukprot:12439676-Alexandrium_andersonii.AAC.1
MNSAGLSITRNHDIGSRGNSRRLDVLRETAPANKVFRLVGGWNTMARQNQGADYSGPDAILSARA